MDELQLVKVKSLMRKGVSDTLKTCMDELYGMFNPSTIDLTNQEVDDHANMHKQMCDYIIYTELASTYKKAADIAKKGMDSSALAMGLGVDPEPAKVIDIYSGEFVFKKRKNKDGVTTAVNDVVTQLALAGADELMVRKAVKAAEKPKSGATYYEVELSD